MQSLRNELQWADVPVDLHDDRDVVLTALRRHIVPWHDLPPKRKNDVEVICAAFDQYRLTISRTSSGIALMYDPPYDEDDDDSYSSFSSLYASRDKRRTCIRWKNLPYHLMMNEKVLIAALRTC